MNEISINCDMGESFGIYSLGDDKALMPHITHANVACGFHASDPDHMHKTVALAKGHNVHVGAHFSLPDLQGFGRREIKMSENELYNCMLYQIGALDAFLKAEGIELSHLKPHGVLYSMAAKQEHVAMAVANVAKVYGLPVYGMTGTIQEKIYKREGVPFVAEFFSDLDYDGEGQLIVTKKHNAPDVGNVVSKVDLAITQGLVKSTEGDLLPTRVETICVHSDTPNAVELAHAITNYLNSSPTKEHTA